MDGFFSSDGTRVYTAAVDGSVGVWDAGTGALVHFLGRDDSETSVSVQMSPENHLIVSAFSDGRSAIWNGASSATTTLQEGRVGKFDYAGFSFDESTVAAPEKRDDALIWDSFSWERLGTFGMFEDSIENRLRAMNEANTMP